MLIKPLFTITDLAEKRLINLQRTPEFSRMHWYKEENKSTLMYNNCFFVCAYVVIFLPILSLHVYTSKTDMC